MNVKEMVTIPENWKVCSLCDLATVKGGKRLPAGEEFADGPTEFPYLRVTDMVNGTIDESNIVYVKPEIEPLIREYKISCRDLYVTIAGTLGQFGKIPSKFDLAQLTENAAKITDLDISVLDSDYLCHLLRSDSIAAQVNIATGIGAGVPKLPLYRIEKLEIGFPEALPEQRKIAKILTTVDNLIEKTEALIAKYQAIKQGMMHDLFTRGVDEHGHLRPPYDEAPELYKESEIGWIPKEWEAKRLGEILKEVSGFLQTGPFGSQLHAYEYLENGVPVVMPQDITAGKILTDEIAQVSEDKARSLARHRVRSNDIIFSRRGDLSRAAAISKREESWLCGTGCFLLRAPRDKIDANWLSYLYRYDSVQRQVEANAVGSTMPSLNNVVMARLLMPFPQHQEQVEIGRRIRSFDSLVQKEMASQNKLNIQKTGLMQDLLTGKVRVKIDESQEISANA